MKNFELAYIRRMAKNYRIWFPDTTIHRAVHQAVIAYELYRETEVEIMYETDQRT